MNAAPFPNLHLLCSWPLILSLVLICQRTEGVRRLVARCVRVRHTYGPMPCHIPLTHSLTHSINQSINRTNLPQRVCAGKLGNLTQASYRGTTRQQQVPQAIHPARLRRGSALPRRVHALLNATKDMFLLVRRIQRIPAQPIMGEPRRRCFVAKVGT